MHVYAFEIKQTVCQNHYIADDEINEQSPHPLKPSIYEGICRNRQPDLDGKSNPCTHFPVDLNARKRFVSV